MHDLVLMLLLRWRRWHNLLPSTGAFLDVGVIPFGLFAVVPVVACLRSRGRLGAVLLNVDRWLRRRYDCRRIVWIRVVRIVIRRVIVARERYAKVQPDTHVSMAMICQRGSTDGNSCQQHKTA
jgi:hypothetical protein